MNFSKGKANNAPDGHHASGTADGVSVGMLTRSPSVVPEVVSDIGRQRSPAAALAEDDKTDTEENAHIASPLHIEGIKHTAFENGFQTGLEIGYSIHHPLPSPSPFDELAIGGSRKRKAQDEIIRAPKRTTLSTLQSASAKAHSWRHSAQLAWLVPRSEQAQLDSQLVSYQDSSLEQRVSRLEALQVEHNVSTSDQFRPHETKNLALQQKVTKTQDEAAAHTSSWVFVNNEWLATFQ